MPRISQQYCCVLRPLRIFRLWLRAAAFLPHAAQIRVSVASILLIALCVLASVCPVAYAQSSTATLSGTVEDQNGALISGASIALINAEQATQRLATTNDD